MGGNDMRGVGGEAGGADDENVDQYFDDGGETFLPADHVSHHQLSKTPLFNI